MEQIKILVVGDSGVGKTHFIQQLLPFNKKKIKPTIACEIHVIKYQEHIFQLHEISGSSQYKTYLDLYFTDQKFDALFYFFDSQKSMRNFYEWLKIIFDKNQVWEIPIFLFQTKNEIKLKMSFFRNVFNCYQNENFILSKESEIFHMVLQKLIQKKQLKKFCLNQNLHFNVYKLESIDTGAKAFFQGIIANIKSLFHRQKYNSIV